MFGWFRKNKNKVKVKEQAKVNRTYKEAKDVDLIRFFRNEQADCEGRMLEDILKYTPDEIEHKHNFIQWIFPTISKSRFNRNAPIIDDSFKDRFQKDNLVKCNFCKSCQLYLNYIGFQCKDGNITCTPFHKMFHQLPSHNLLRITRVLESLNQIGNSDCSQRLYKSIMDEVELHPEKIPLETKLYWEATQPQFATKREVPNMLLGAIAGDIIGSIYEFYPVKSIAFDLFTFQSKFTDDSVMTVANADWLLTGDSLLGVMQEYGNKHLSAGYGGMFWDWLRAYDPEPYNSFGNGSAMRVSPVGWAFNTLEETLEAAKISAEITHNHPEGIKGAQATAACIYLARTGKSKQEIKEYVEDTFGYNLNRTCDEIRPTYGFDETSQGTVPESIIAFLESTDYESAVRLAVSLGGDADTMGAITGGIAEAYYKEIPQYIKEEVIKRLPTEFVDIMVRFTEKFVIGK